MLASGVFSLELFVNKAQARRLRH